MPEPPWSHERGVESVLARWQAAGAVKRCLAAERHLPPAPERSPRPPIRTGPARGA
jgi:hypothetical protein